MSRPAVTAGVHGQARGRGQGQNVKEKEGREGDYGREANGGLSDERTGGRDVQVEGEEPAAFVPLRMSPRARTAMRTDSSWSASAILGVQRGGRGGVRAGEGGGGGGSGRREGDCVQRGVGEENKHMILNSRCCSRDRHHVRPIQSIPILSSRPCPSVADSREHIMVIHGTPSCLQHSRTPLH